MVLPHEKLHSYAVKHLALIYTILLDGNTNRARDFYSSSVEDMVRKIKSTGYSSSLIDTAHSKVVAQYNNNSEKGIHRKGRPYGSKNKGNNGALTTSIDLDEMFTNEEPPKDHGYPTLDNCNIYQLEAILTELRAMRRGEFKIGYGPSNNGSQDDNQAINTLGMTANGIKSILDSCYGSNKVIEAHNKVKNNNGAQVENSISGDTSGDNSALSSEALKKYLLISTYNQDQSKLKELMVKVGDAYAQHSTAIEALQSNDAVNTAAIGMAFEKIKNITENRPTVLHLTTPALPELTNVGQVHFQFPTLLKMCNARLRSNERLNIWVHGPAGTGKTFSAIQAARTLNLAFHYNGALTTSYQLLGYQDANGRYVSTAFREAWEHGGVYLFDEIDASMPDALLALNGALANGLCRFPDKQVPRHSDCIILAGANTTGQGATMEYAGRMKQDAALTDRFVFLHWPQDKALEDSMCADKDWLDMVRKYRANIETQGVKNHKITSRATLYGEALLAAGIDLETVKEATLKKGLSEAQFKNLGA